ncbi:MAG: baseplate J/gp47 family protein, partial [Paracoccus sp. (in: a-proteobacteria)]|nr:baseplate J/gp47 family protein [Paracoccus sp. (in: a-proteobacteria)]
LIARAPQLGPVLELESEPLTKLLEVCAYREMVIRARINDAARAVMLATATGADLDNLAALLGVERLMLAAGDAQARPPIPPVYESDDDMRLRAQLALEGFSVAGPRGAYEYHARSASADVADVAVDSPEPGKVRVTVMARTGDGAADATLLDEVRAALNDERVRPLCDTVSVRSASVTSYTIQAALSIAPGPDAGVVLERARAAAAAYAENTRRIGTAVTISGLHAALHGPGVQRVALTRPTAEVDPGPGGVAHCTNITVVAA